MTRGTDVGRKTRTGDGKDAKINVGVKNTTDLRMVSVVCSGI